MLTPREQLVLRLRFGLGDTGEHSYSEIVQQLGFSRQSVWRTEARALYKLRHPAYSRQLRLWDEQTPPEVPTIPNLGPVLYPELQTAEVIEGVKCLSPDLIKHLKTHGSDLERLPWAVFEHLVAEFLAANGFEDVRLVGRDSSTSADVYAAKAIPPLANGLRLFVEVKKWKQCVGIEVINEVIGAVFSERPRHGWNAAMVVAKGGFRQLRKFTVPEIALMNVELREKQDLMQWLEDYKPSKSGLWLPYPKRNMPQTAKARAS